MPSDDAVCMIWRPGGCTLDRARVVRGVTLTELLIAIAILAVLLGLAVPNLREFYVSNRLASASNEFMTGLATARSEAIRRATNVVMANNLGASANWSNGWRICADVDRSSTCGASEETIRIGPVAGNLTTLYATFATGVVVFDAQGSLKSTAGMFVVCYDSTTFSQGTRSRSRAILVNSLGRVRLALDADGNGVPESDGGLNITGSCTQPVA